jgi:endonuclease-8
VPEGDTIYRAAQTLDKALSGRTVSRFESVFPALTRIDQDEPLRGRVVERVTSRGKHLLIHFSGGLVLRTHMRMHGSWHIYRPGERWQRPKHEMRVVIGTDAYEAVAFTVPVAEFLQGRELDRQSDLAALGPDPLAPGFDAAAAVARLSARGDTDIAEALLDQRALAGIGNMWKSEMLYATRINPFIRVSDLDRAALERIVAKAAQLLRTAAVERPRLEVYERGGQPCRRCHTPVSRRKQGPNARSTYWCETCQPRRRDVT